MADAPFGEHCIKSCPELLPLEAKYDPCRAEVFHALGELGVQCPFLQIEDGKTACALPWSLFSHLAAKGGMVPYSQTVEAAHAIVDGKLTLEELPLGNDVEPELALMLWERALKLAARRYGECGN